MIIELYIIIMIYRVKSSIQIYAKLVHAENSFAEEMKFYEAFPLFRRVLCDEVDRTIHPASLLLLQSAE